jgi:hypothetical protein
MSEQEILVKKELLIHIDSLLSLMAHRYTKSEVPHDIIEDLSHTSGTVRELYEKRKL